MSQEVKIIGGIIIVSLVLLLGGAFLLGRSDTAVAGDATVNEKILYDNIHHKKTVKEAKIVLVEFADFQCPACGAAYPYVHELLAKHGTTITFIYRHFPLPQHSNARLAATAAEAAGKLGGDQKFWDMYDILFTHQADWSESSDAANIFTDYAVILGLDKKAFHELLLSTEFAGTIQKDVTEGESLGINSTPTFFLNGKKLQLTSFGDLEREVESNL